MVTVLLIVVLIIMLATVMIVVMRVLWRFFNGGRDGLSNVDQLFMNDNFLAVMVAAAVGAVGAVVVEVVHGAIAVVVCGCWWTMIVLQNVMCM